MRQLNLKKNRFQDYACLILLVLMLTPNARAATNTSSIKAPSPWRFRLSDRSEYNVSDAKDDRNDASAETISRLTYNFDPQYYLMAGVDISHSWGTQSSGKAKFAIQDPYIEFGNKSVAKLFGDTNLKLAGRLFAPLSKDSRDTEKILEFRGYAVLNRDFSKWFNLAVISDTRIFGQNWATFINDQGKHVATKKYGWLYFLEGTFTASRQISFYQDVGAIDFWYNVDPERSEVKLNQARQSFFYYETAMTVQFDKTWSITLGLTSADRDMLNQNTNFAILNEKEMSYFFQARADI